jgi:hypothetical protein
MPWTLYTRVTDRYAFYSRFLWAPLPGWTGLKTLVSIEIRFVCAYTHARTHTHKYIYIYIYIKWLIYEDNTIFWVVILPVLLRKRFRRTCLRFWIFTDCRIVWISTPNFITYLFERSLQITIHDARDKCLCSLVTFYVLYRCLPEDYLERPKHVHVGMWTIKLCAFSWCLTYLCNPKHRHAAYKNLKKLCIILRRKYIVF